MLAFIITIELIKDLSMIALCVLKTIDKRLEEKTKKMYSLIDDEEE